MGRPQYGEYREASPITYVGAVTTPLLLLHDVRDPRVSITNSFEFFHALRDRGQPVKFVAFPVVGHFPPDPVHQVQVYDRSQRQSTEERIADTRAATVADSVMYRQALAGAAEARGWSVHWYGRERVLQDAALAIGGKDVDAFLRAMGRSIGPPWRAKEKTAAAAALAAAARM